VSFRAPCSGDTFSSIPDLASAMLVEKGKRQRRHIQSRVIFFDIDLFRTVLSPKLGMYHRKFGCIIYVLTYDNYQ
jgi:hypothetical protein